MNINQACIDELADLGTRWMIKLKDGRRLEGYILDVNDSSFTFGSGGPLASIEADTILFDNVDVSLASYFDEEKRRYLDVRWDWDTSAWRVVG